MGDASGALKASTSETSPAESSKAVEPVPKTEKQWLDDTIDYEGQRVVELLIQAIMIGSGVIGFVVGYAVNSLSICFLIVFLGAIVCSAVTIPPWPVFKAHPIKWLDDIRTEKQKQEDQEFGEDSKTWWWPF